MSLNEHWKNMAYYRLDRITNMTLTDKPVTPINEVEGFKSGIDYKELSSARPYLYTDKLEKIEFLADTGIVDQIVDWFGDGVEFEPLPDQTKVKACLKASPNAMEHWAMQYVNFVEITKPVELRERIKASLNKAVEKYND